MGTLYTSCKIENPLDRERSAVVPKLLVDSGSELSWVAERTLERLGIAREKKDVAFVMANGQHVTRNVGFAIVRLDRHFTIDEIVFAEPGDLQLLGARTLDGLNLSIDLKRRRLLAAGPLPAATVAAYQIGSPSRRTNAWNASSRRLVTGPGVVVPIFRPSTSAMGMTSAPVPVRKHSSAV